MENLQSMKWKDSCGNTWDSVIVSNDGTIDRILRNGGSILKLKDIFA